MQWRVAVKRGKSKAMREGPLKATHQARVGIHADVRLHAEMPLVAFLRLMHLRIAAVPGVFW